MISVICANLVVILSDYGDTIALEVDVMTPQSGVVLASGVVGVLLSDFFPSRISIKHQSTPALFDYQLCILLQSCFCWSVPARPTKRAFFILLIRAALWMFD